MPARQASSRAADLTFVLHNYPLTRADLQANKKGPGGPFSQYRTLPNLILLGEITLIGFLDRAH
jgi:hypothetical protein